MTLSFAPLPSPDSWLRRLDARWKLAGVLVLILGIAVLRSLTCAAIGLSGAIVLAWSARMPWRWYLVHIAPLAVFLGFFLVTFPFLSHAEAEPLRIGNIAISRSGLILALLIAAKAVALVTLVLTLLVATPLNQLLTAAHALGVPGLLAQLVLLSYQYLYLLTSEMGRLRTAVRVRGYRNRMAIHCYRTIAHLGGSLLVRSHDRAERVAQAMRCRGFDGRFRCLERFRTQWRDVAFLCCMLVVVVVMVVLDFFV